MPIKAVITDIEGTTTSISFVKDKLFPYAVEHVQDYLTENWTNADVQEAVNELRAQYVIDVANKIDGAVAISDAEAKEQVEQIAEVVANVKWQISIDRKTTSLKKLQGLIWSKGYNSGAIKGHVYADVPKAFERWTADNIKLYIYSSGSVAAQKLLFANSEHGDLTSKISGYFDTNIGAKQEKASYEKIVKDVGCEPMNILFLTDIVKEAAAAKEAGIKVALLVRSGNAPLTDEEKAEYEIFTTFDDIHSEFVIGKRKCDDNLTEAETNAVKIAKLSDEEESVIASDANTESVKETNGIDRTDNSINTDDTTKMETERVPNGAEEVTTMKIDEKTEIPIDIPITQPQCDLKHKTDNLDVDVVVERDIVKGEKDSKPQPLNDVNDVIKPTTETTATNEALPMEVVDDKKPSAETKETVEDVEMKEATPIDIEMNTKPKSDAIDDDDGLAKIVEVTTDVDLKHVVVEEPIVEPVAEIKSDDQTDKKMVSEEVPVVDKVVSNNVEIVDKNGAEATTEVPAKQNGDHTQKEEKIVEKATDKVDEEPTTPAVAEEATTTPAVAEEATTTPAVAEAAATTTTTTTEKTETAADVSDETNQPKAVDTEKSVTDGDDKVATIENGAKETEEIDNKENIPIEIKEKENIIEIPIHIDGDNNQAAQKPSVITTSTNGNGVEKTKDDLLETAAATNSNKEKMSRIELIIEEKNNDNGQLTETTTHIVKEIIVKNNACDTAAENNVEIASENV